MGLFGRIRILHDPVQFLDFHNCIFVGVYIALSNLVQLLGKVIFWYHIRLRDYVWHGHIWYDFDIELCVYHLYLSTLFWLA